MFRGVNILSLDTKGRMAMPTRYREALETSCGGKLVATVDPDHCLLIYPYPEWQEIERKLVRLPSFNKQSRGLLRMLVGHATECDMDGSGRILISAPLRDFASLTKRTVLIGQGNRFELWDEQLWNENCEKWLEDAHMDNPDLPPELESLSL